MKILAKSAVRTWAAGLNGSTSRACILSPYVTSNTLDLLVERSAESGCDLYTVFDAENFMVGASSIRALRKASVAGCGLFHIDDLHAKVVIGSMSFATIGSQNVTQRGTRNKEVTTVFTDEASVGLLSDSVAPWVAAATPITDEMLDRMEELITPLMKEYRVLVKRASAINGEVEAEESLRLNVETLLAAHDAELERAKEAARIAAEVDKMRDNLVLQQSLIFQTKIAQAVTRSTESSEIKYCRTRIVESSRDNYVTLSREFGGDLNIWGSDTLTRAHRFLCLAEDSGRLGWARLFATRISQFGRSVERYERIFLDGAKWQTEFSAEWDGGGAVGHNLTVSLKREGFTGPAQIVLACSMTIEALEVLSGHTTITSSLMSRHLQKILSGGGEFASATLPLILSPFRYISRLHGGAGGDARQFLGEEHDCWRLRRVKRESRDFLIASPGWS